jgi:hypothetical protein
MTGELTAKRQAAADAAFAAYDFGADVDATDGWEWLQPGTRMQCRVYLRHDEASETGTVRCWFTVEFADVNSAEVAEAYAIDAHGNVFGGHEEDPADSRAAPCAECGEPDCPGLVTCPVCGTDDHGADAVTHLADHGQCWSCHKEWQMTGAPLSRDRELVP